MFFKILFGLQWDFKNPHQTRIKMKETSEDIKGQQEDVSILTVSL